MLTVTAFKPISNVLKRGNNQNTPNKISFMANPVCISPEVKIGAITQDILQKNADVLDTNFVKAFLEPVSTFLLDNKVSFKIEGYDKPVKIKNYIVKSNSAATASLADILYQIPIHSEYKFPFVDNRAIGITKNHAKLKLIESLIEGKLAMKKDNNLLEGVIIPEDIVKATKQISLALQEFEAKIASVNLNSSKKAQSIISAYKILMPEI